MDAHPQLKGQRLSSPYLLAASHNQYHLCLTQNDTWSVGSHFYLSFSRGEKLTTVSFWEQPAEEPKSMMIKITLCRREELPNFGSSVISLGVCVSSCGEVILYHLVAWGGEWEQENKCICKVCMTPRRGIASLSLCACVRMHMQVALWEHPLCSQLPSLLPSHFFALYNLICNWCPVCSSWIMGRGVKMVATGSQFSPKEEGKICLLLWRGWRYRQKERFYCPVFSHNTHPHKQANQKCYNPIKWFLF